jgi:hypothetical protein
MKKKIAKKIKKIKETFHIQSFLGGVMGVMLLVGAFVLMSRFGLAPAVLSGAIGISNRGALADEKVADIMEELVEKNLTTPGTDVAIENVAFKKEMGLYEVKMKFGEQTDVVAYLSGDGKYFIKEAMSLEEIKQKSKEQEELAVAEAERKKNIKVPKTKKPEVEVFVMSHCPYGTQVQKGFLPVIKTLGDKADIRFKFVDYLMHGKKEMDENLNQYCIEKEEPGKQQAYLECFLGSSGEPADSEKCMKSAGIAQAKITKCVADTDNKFLLTKKFEDKSSWQGGQYPLFELQKADNEKYQVKGSPTVVINGTMVEPNRDPNSLLASVCLGFENAPKECAEALSTKAPSPGFGVGVASATSSDAGCAE